MATKSSDNQPYETTFFAFKHDIPQAVAHSIITRYGPSRIHCDLVAKAYKDGTKGVVEAPDLTPANDLTELREESEEPYQARYFARKHEIPLSQAVDILRQYGPSRRSCNQAAAKLRMSLVYNTSKRRSVG